MLCFRDKSFCSSSRICGNPKCSLRFTAYDERAAEEWWGGKGAPIAFSPYKDTEYCPGFIEKNLRVPNVAPLQSSGEFRDA